MLKTVNIIKSVPFFNHLTSGELDFLEKNGSRVLIGTGKSVDLKKTNSMCLILSGMFEIEAPGNTDIVYLSRGSFFGNIPFCNYRRRGVVKALVDSNVILLPEDILLKLFLSSYKSLRGYMRILNKTGLGLTESGKEYFNTRSAVIACVSTETGSGKTIAASALGLRLSGKRKTLILDMSYDGKSLLEYFGKENTAPLSEKQHGSKSPEMQIHERIVEISDGLHVLNVANGSRVRVDSQIFNIVLFLLSREYPVVIADVSSQDLDLKNHVIEKSDYVLNFIPGNSKQKKGDAVPDIDTVLSEGQRVFNIRNEFHGRGTSVFVGGYTLERCDDYTREPGFQSLSAFAGTQFFSDMEVFVSSKKRSLILESSQIGSASYCGMLHSLADADLEIDWIYSSAYSYILVAMMLLVDRSGLKEAYEDFFSADFAGRIMNISFPDEHLYGMSRFLKYAGNIAGNKRIEMFRSLAMCKVAGESQVEKVFSSGGFKELMSASFSCSPFFPGVKIGNDVFSSGFPESYVLPLECCRNLSDEIISVELGNRNEFEITDKKYPQLFRKIMAKNSLLFRKEDNLYCDMKFILEVSEKEFRFDRIFSSTKKTAEVILSKLI